MFHRTTMLTNALAMSAAAGVVAAAGKPLTERQTSVLDAIDAAITETGMPPTERELAARLGLKRTVIHLHMQALLRKGAVTARRSPDGRVIARSLVIVKGPTNP